MGHFSFWFTLTGRNIHTYKKNAEALLVKSDEIGLEVNAENTKYAPVSWTAYRRKSKQKKYR